jgi:hypothetical protein
MANLICLIASHVTLNRLPLIRELFHSISNQTKFVPIYMSWSSDQNCIDDFEDMIAETSNIEFFYSKTKLSQFEHYQKIMTKVSWNKDDHVMFSDDDDLWSPLRIELMSHVTNDAFAQSGTCYSRIVFVNYAEINYNGERKRKEFKTKTPADIDHWATVVPFSIFAEFFTVFPEWIIKNKYCDTAFVTFTASYKPEQMKSAFSDNEEIVYFYRFHQNSLCDVSKREQHLHAEKLKSKITPELRRFIELMGEEQESLVNCLCTNMEVSVVKYYPKRPSQEEFMSRCATFSRLCVLRLFPLVLEWANEVLPGNLFL